MPNIERVADTHCHTGEGPIWHPDEDVLYWVDIPAGRLFRYDPETDDHELVYERDGAIGGFTVQEDGSLLLFEEKGRIERWDDGETTTVVEEIDGEQDSRFNDVIADPAGRVFCGTMPTDDHPGRLYRLELDGTVTEVLEEVALPNGLGFTPDREQLYFTESQAHSIYRFDYDESDGSITNREVFVDVSDEEGVPDGMTVNADGDVWSARWDGHCLVRYSPDGVEQERIEFPARKVSCITFGGEDYTDAYVTTALGPGEGGKGSRDDEGEGAGALFRVPDLDEGVPEFRSNVEI